MYAADAASWWCLLFWDQWDFTCGERQEKGETFISLQHSAMSHSKSLWKAGGYSSKHFPWMSLRWKISVVCISRTCLLAPVAICCVLFWQKQMIWISLNRVCNRMETFVLTFHPQEIQERLCSYLSKAFLLSHKGLNSALPPAIAWSVPN